MNTGKIGNAKQMTVINVTRVYYGHFLDKRRYVWKKN